MAELSWKDETCDISFEWVSAGEIWEHIWDDLLIVTIEFVIQIGLESISEFASSIAGRVECQVIRQSGRQVKGPNDCQYMDAITIWLFNIAMDNHHFQ